MDGGTHGWDILMSLSMALNLNFSNHLAMSIVYFDITLAQSNEIHG